MTDHASLNRSRVYVAPCGVGLGHATRCVMVADRLSRAGWDVIFSTYLDGLEYLRRTDWPTLSSPPISFRTREDGTIDTKLTATQNGVTVGIWKFIKQLISEIRHVIRCSPDFVVSDTRVSTILAGFLLRKPRLLILNQYSVQMPRYTGHAGPVDKLMLLYARLVWKYGSTLLGFAWGLSTMILIPDYDHPFTVSKYNLSVPRMVLGKVKMIGPIANKAAALGPRRSIGAPPLIFACISGPSNDRKHLVTVLQQLLQELPEDVEVIMSCGNPRGSNRPRTVGRLTVYEWLNQDDYDRIFAGADVIISRAGHGTIMKGLRDAKPLVLIPPPNHTEQANNSRRACEMGVAVELDQSSLDGPGLEYALEKAIQNKAHWPRMLTLATQAQDGVSEIVRMLTSMRSCQTRVVPAGAESPSPPESHEVPQLIVE